MKRLALASLLFFTAASQAAPPTRKSATLGYEHLRRPAPEVGTVAPDFALKTLGTGEGVELSSFTGDRPVALVFGSYT